MVSSGAQSLLFGCASGKSRGWILVKLVAIVSCFGHKVWLMLDRLQPNSSRRTTVGVATWAFLWVAPLPLAEAAGAAGLSKKLR